MDISAIDIICYVSFEREDRGGWEINRLGNFILVDSLAFTKHLLCARPFGH